MNIIELFENAGIYQENVTEFTSEDVIKVKKQFDIEREKNQNLDVNVANDLILAINEYPKELLFISNNRILYNFFSHSNHSRSRFSSDVAVSVDTNAVKSFIGKFLSRDLDAFFSQKVEENKFEILDDFLVVKEYLPQESLDKFNKKIGDKCNFVLKKIEENPAAVEENTALDFLKYRSFYDLLSNFSSPEIDQYVKSIYYKMTSSMVNLGLSSSFLNPMRIAMGNYKAIDYDLKNMLAANKNQASIDSEKTGYSRSSQALGAGSIVIVIAVIKMLFMFARCSR